MNILRKKDKKQEKEFKRLSSLKETDLLSHYREIADEAWKNAIDILDTDSDWKIEQVLLLFSL